jgi:hypothetical protein
VKIVHQRYEALMLAVDGFDTGKKMVSPLNCHSHLHGRVVWATQEQFRVLAAILPPFVVTAGQPATLPPQPQSARAMRTRLRLFTR